MSSNIVRFDAVRSVLYSDITGSYTKLDIPLAHAMRVLHFINDTNGTFMISFDGTTNNVPILGEAFSLYDLTSDQDQNESFRYENGTQLWIKYIVAPTLVANVSNTFYCVGIYGKGE